MEKELAIFKNITPRKEGLDAGNLRKHIFELKEKVWDFEENNFQYIVFYHRENQWWQVGDNSMLIYYYYLAKSIGAKNLKIRHDRDYNKKKWRYGYIRAHSTCHILQIHRPREVACFTLRHNRNIARHAPFEPTPFSNPDTQNT